jgi:CBS-domain-containing membrane protein
MTTLGARQHPHVGRQPELERELADQAVAEGVERRDRGVRVAVRDELVDAERHLLGRLVRERQGEDLRRRGRRVAISQAMRRVMTCVLPVPAPATTAAALAVGHARN